MKFYGMWNAIEVENNDGRVYARPYKVINNIQAPENGLGDKEELFPKRKIEYKDGIGTYYLSQCGTKSVVIMDDLSGIR